MPVLLRAAGRQGWSRRSTVRDRRLDGDRAVSAHSPSPAAAPPTEAPDASERAGGAQELVRTTPATRATAQRTGAPVIGVGAAARNSWRLKSWDAFLIPRPFATVRIAYSDETHMAAANAREAAASADSLHAVMDSAEQRINE